MCRKSGEKNKIAHYYNGLQRIKGRCGHAEKSTEISTIYCKSERQLIKQFENQSLHLIDWQIQEYS